MISADRLWGFLPQFMKRAPKINPDTGKTSLIWTICRAIGDESDDALDTGDLLKARGLANRAYPSEFPDYYVDPDDGANPSAERMDDLYLLGVSRGLYKREAETWFEFEARLIAFPDDVKSYGTPSGMVRELERTGLECDVLEELDGDPQSWVMLSAEDACPIPEDQLSHLFDFESEDETDETYSIDGAYTPAVRGTRIYDGEEEYFTFYLTLTGSAEYSESEIQDIIRRTKPAHTRCYVKYPSADYYEAVL